MGLCVGSELHVCQLVEILTDTRVIQNKHIVPCACVTVHYSRCRTYQELEEHVEIVIVLRDNARNQMH